MSVRTELCQVLSEVNVWPSGAFSGQPEGRSVLNLKRALYLLIYKAVDFGSDWAG